MPSDRERVTLANAYFHFIALSPSERQARIDLVSAIRAGGLELIAGKITEHRPGETQPRISHNEAIPAAALTDRLMMTFDLELSSALWENPPPNSYFTFEGITVARDQVLALRPVPPAQAKTVNVEPKGDGEKYRWDIISTELGVLIYAGEIDPEKSPIGTQRLD